MIKQLRLTIMAVILMLWNISASLAASVSVTPAIGNSFTVQGNNLDGVSGIEQSVSYDGSLSFPSVTTGSLTSVSMLAADTNNPGSIIIKISSNTFSGSGPIASISFTSGSGNVKTVGDPIINYSNTVPVGGSTPAAAPPVTIPDLSSSSSTSTSPQTSTTSTPAASQGTTPQITAATSQGTSTQTTAPASTGSSISTFLGTVTMPSDAPMKNDAKPAETTTAAVPQPAETPTAKTAAVPPTPAEQPPAPKPEEPKKVEETKITSYTSLLERFRAYQGEKSPTIFTALFKKEVAPTISQEPSVVLSNGKTTVTIIVNLSPQDGKSPNFALNGAKLILLKKDKGSNKWIIEALPQENTYNLSLTILNGNEVIEYPITASPFIKSVTINSAEFTAFLKNPGKAADLNGDGRHDYIDDFIYTANYIVLMDKAKPDSRKMETGMSVSSR